MIHVFYHSDLDGSCAAAIIERTSRERKEWYPIDYKDKPDFSKISREDLVFILDFSFSIEDFRKLLDITDRVIWIDHHATAIEKVQASDLPEIEGLRAMGHPSGAWLTWMFVTKDESVPYVVGLISAWDTWTHGDQDEVLLFKDGIELDNLHPTSAIWNAVFSATDAESGIMRKIREAGAIVKKYREQKNRSLIADMSFMGKDVMKRKGES